MFSRIGAAAYKADLDNTISLCEFVGNPQDKFKSIHIAGTNGKGSVSHMLAAILQTAGYKTGLYTSPHLKDFRERIKIDGAMIPEETVISFTEKIKPLIKEIQPSFFEITVAMAFEHFAEQEIDIAIIETGLGGRLDSTNIISPVLSVITNIGMDHTNLLGDTIEKIASEKAGIIKQNVPVAIGEVLPETLPVFEKTAQEKNAPLSIASQKMFANSWKWEKNELIIEIAEDGKRDHNIFHLDLNGIYQRMNLITVLESCSILKKLDWKIDDNAISKGLRHVKKLTGFHGRWDIIHQAPLIVLDVGHNEDGIRQIMEQIELTTHDRLHIVIGMVRDKDIENVLSLFPKTGIYYFTRATIPRALNELELETEALKHGLHGKTYPEVNIALNAAKAAAKKEDMILVCGSVFLVGEVLIH
jgi:dihydrofolate synthase / folylpolyglutamate synthase